MTLRARSAAIEQQEQDYFVSLRNFHPTGGPKQERSPAARERVTVSPGLGGAAAALSGVGTRRASIPRSSVSTDCVRSPTVLYPIFDELHLKRVAGMVPHPDAVRDLHPEHVAALRRGRRG